jgi:hypothetical protein
MFQKRRGPKCRSFDPNIAEIVFLKISRGASLERVCKLPGMPGRWVIRRWRKENLEFNKALRQARRFRREFYLDSLLELVGSIKHLRAGRGSRLALYKWLSKVRPDYKTFGFSTKGIITRAMIRFREREIAESLQSVWTSPTAAPLFPLSQNKKG